MKQLFYMLLPFLNKNYSVGRGIRSMITDEKGRTPNCLFCGNIANAVGRVEYLGSHFNVPICKKHAYDHMNKHFSKWELVFPCVIKLRLKGQKFKSNNPHAFICPK